MSLELVIKMWDGASASTEGGQAGQTTESRYRGVPLGAAVGNLLGIPVEGMDSGLLRSRFPSGVRDIDPEERHRPRDDDFAQTVISAEALLAGE